MPEGYDSFVEPSGNGIIRLGCLSDHDRVDPGKVALKVIDDLSSESRRQKRIDWWKSKGNGEIMDDCMKGLIERCGTTMDKVGNIHEHIGIWETMDYGKIFNMATIFKDGDLICNHKGYGVFVAIAPDTGSGRYVNTPVGQFKIDVSPVITSRGYNNVSKLTKEQKIKALNVDDLSFKRVDKYLNFNRMVKGLIKSRSLDKYANDDKKHTATIPVAFEEEVYKVTIHIEKDPGAKPEYQLGEDN